ncbi:hypothetical protein TgHK011_000726 [Trichoderma gracile]|nr:hypothetical protein TgHK011_000726 [Trichoderma gracile]
MRLRLPAFTRGSSECPQRLTPVLHDSSGGEKQGVDDGPRQGYWGPYSNITHQQHKQTNPNLLRADDDNGDKAPIPRSQADAAQRYLWQQRI